MTHRLWNIVLTGSIFAGVTAGAEPVKREADAYFEEIRSNDPARRNAAAEELQRLALERFAPTLPALLQGLKDPNADVRYYALVAIGGAASEEQNARLLHRAEGGVLDVLADDQARVRQQAIRGSVVPTAPGQRSE